MTVKRTSPSSPVARRGFLLVLGALLLLLGCGGAKGNAADANQARAASDFGVLLMAHGGTPEWNASVLDAVKPLRDRYDIEVAFGMADAMSLKDAVAKLESRKRHRIAVVRLFVSGESFVPETEQILGLRVGAPAEAEADPHGHPIMKEMMGAGGAGHGGHGGHGAAADGGAGHDMHATHGGHGGHGEAGDGGVGHGPHAGHGAGAPGGGGHSMAFFRLETSSSFALSSDGLADAPGMGNVLADRAVALSKTPAQEDVLVLAHGPGDDAENARWLSKLEERAAVIKARAPFRRVQVETLREDWPDKRVAAEARIRAYVERAKSEGGKAVVIPFRVQGFGPYAEVLKGLDYASDSQGLIPHAEVTAWIGQEIAALEKGSFRAPVK